MRRLHLVVLFICLSLFLTIISDRALAVSENVIISNIQLGGVASAKEEFVEIYNNSPSEINITNWCLYYQSTSLTQYKLACFVPENENQYIFLPAHSSAFLVSNELATANPLLGSDLKFSSTLSGVGGYVRVLDEKNNEIDRAGWGVSTPENDLALAAPSGKVLSRKKVSDKIFQDTDVYSADFTIELPSAVHFYGRIYEVLDVCSNIIGIQENIPEGLQKDDSSGCVPIPIDICLNLDGIQLVIPSGFGLDSVGGCQPDVCANIIGLQIAIPGNLESDSQGNCARHDMCKSIDGIQNAIPDGMIMGASGDCINPATKLIVTELLPNAIGDDDGNEFIELYNPSQAAVDLSEYRLFIGDDRTREYKFPIGSSIRALSYMAFSDDDMGFRLINTTSSVQLTTKDELIDTTDKYVNPKGGESWAVINDIWQFTNQATLGFENKVSAILNEDNEGEVLGLVSELQPCAVGYYRYVETNRCRKVVVESSDLVPCRDDQYRSEITGRCRNIIANVAALIPCDDGEERNPATNRCRKITVATTELEPCKEGQERNQTTNRCRNIVSAQVPVADYAPEKTTPSSNMAVVNWSLFFVSIAAVGYGVWEWRQEIAKLFKKR